MSLNSVDKSNVNDQLTYEFITPEFLNLLRTSGLPNHIIKFKVGTPIMLMRNLDQSKGLCNGTRLTVSKLEDRKLNANIMYGKHDKNFLYIPRIKTPPSQSPWQFKLSKRRFQFIIS